MKMIILIGIMSTCIFVSCNKEIPDPVPSKTSDISDNKVNYTPKIKKHIYYATWDEWGRSSLSCNGWGLCNFVDCWFCCTENGTIVDCKNGTAINNSGVVEIDENSGVGFLTIKLNPNIDEQSNAILNRLTLYVDDDIIGKKVTLIKGEYHFDRNIGRYGGYLIDARKI